MNCSPEGWSTPHPGWRRGRCAPGWGRSTAAPWPSPPAPSGPASPGIRGGREVRRHRSGPVASGHYFRDVREISVKKIAAELPGVLWEFAHTKTDPWYCLGRASWCADSRWQPAQLQGGTSCVDTLCDTQKHVQGGAIGERIKHAVIWPASQEFGKCSQGQCEGVGAPAERQTKCG